MRLVHFFLVLALPAAACLVHDSGAPAGRDAAGTMPEVKLEFLTRDGCRNTPVMLENLKTAIAAGKIRARFTVIQQGALPPDDPRKGYPTPTLLMNGQDVFGLPVPQQPFPEPS